MTPEGHPERVARLGAVEKALAGEGFEALVRRTARLGTLEEALACHDPHYLDELVAAMPAGGYAQIDADTVVSPGSREAIFRALGAALDGVDAVMTGEAANVFCATRPPGHHAESDRAMGFCFVNNAAVAARYAQRRHGAERIVVIDWDVHHGNGTQEIFWSDASVLYASTHEMPLYPGTGSASETGEHGTIVNAPLRSGDDGAVFRDVMESLVLPRIEAHAPDLIVISAGFDAHWRDPLANLRFTEEDFAWATKRLMEIAARRCNGRIVSVLEGGYDLTGLGASAAAHVAALMGR